MGHHLEGEPGGVGPEPPRGQMIEAHPVFQVPDGVLDLGVTAVQGFEGEGLSLPVGDEGVVIVGGKEGQLTPRRGGDPLHPLRQEGHPGQAHRTPGATYAGGAAGPGSRTWASRRSVSARLCS